jgi:hypothetical protein
MNKKDGVVLKRKAKATAEMEPRLKFFSQQDFLLSH